MTHREFITMQFEHKTEFRIMFHRDDTPTWLLVTAIKVSESGCTLKFSTDGAFERVIGALLGLELDYTWDELSENNTDLMEIWV